MATSKVFEGEQTILFIGKTGSGKSRLINLLAQEKIAESRQSIVATTMKCQLHSVRLNEILYRLIDTPGFGDSELSQDEVSEQMRELSQLNVQNINWVVVILNGSIRLTKETATILQNIFSFLNLSTYKDHVLFCITHADGWNEQAKLRYLAQLNENPVYQIYPDDSAEKFVFIGAPDPDERDSKDKELYVAMEEEARNTLLENLSYIKAFNLQDAITKWQEADTRNKRGHRVKEE
ncbi:unnamed protein product, partial [Adineta steineri]